MTAFALAATLSMLGLCLLAAVELIVGRLTGRSLIPWRNGEDRPFAAIGFEELTAFYQGTKRYELDDRDRRTVLREDVRGGDPPFGVDLNGGRAIVPRVSSPTRGRPPCPPDP